MATSSVAMLNAAVHTPADVRLGAQDEQRRQFVESYQCCSAQVKRNGSQTVVDWWGHRLRRMWGRAAPACRCSSSIVRAEIGEGSMGVEGERAPGHQSSCVLQTLDPLASKL